MQQRKRRTRGHVIADIGVRYVEYIIAKSRFTSIQAPAGGDYGVDLYYFTFDAEGYAENGAVRVQVRSTERLDFRSDGSATVRVDCRHLRYRLMERLPVLLTVYDASRDAAFWVDIQAVYSDRPVVGRTTSISLSRRRLFGIECVRAIAARKNDRLRADGDPVYEE